MMEYSFRLTIGEIILLKVCQYCQNSARCKEIHEINVISYYLFLYGTISVWENKICYFPTQYFFPVDLAVRYKLCFDLIRGICSVVERWHKINNELWLSKVCDVDQHSGQTFLLLIQDSGHHWRQKNHGFKLFGRKRSTSQPLTSFWTTETQSNHLIQALLTL